MWELDHKESWVPKNWCLWTVLEKTLESPLESKEIQPVHLKGNQSWIFIGRADAEDETPVLWPLNVKNWLIGKDPDAGKDWRQEETGTTEDEMVRWLDFMAMSLSKLWELVMPPSHLILCRPLFLLPPIPPSIRVFSNESDQPRQHIKKQKHYFAYQGLSKSKLSMVFPVVMYGCESWTINKAEHRRMDAFELWC